MGGTAVHEQEDMLEWERGHPFIKLSGAKAKMTVTDYGFRCAVANVVMTEGRHFCEFTLVEGDEFKIGVVRPNYGEAPHEKTTHMKDPHLDPEHCA